MEPRERIVRAAAELLARGGREAVSTRAVGAAAGVQAPTIYRQFGDMRGLLDEVARETLAGYLREKAGRVPSDDPVEDLRKGFALLVEFGRANPDSFYAGWFDEAGLAREVLDRAGPGGDGRVLTRLWDARTDRSARDSYHPLAPGSVLLVSGPLLLGGGLAFDFTVHLEMSPAALLRRTPPGQQWTLPAFARYATEVDPAAFADVVLRVDDPRRPAMVEERW